MTRKATVRSVTSVKTFSLLLLILAISGLLFYTVLQRTEPFRLVTRVFKPVQESVDFRREIAAQLADITRELNGFKSIIGAHIPLRLNRIITQLDGRSAISDADMDRTPSNRSEPATTTPEHVDVCAEEYRGTKYGFPFYQEGFVIAPSCIRQKRRPISELVTVLLVIPAEEAMIRFGNRLESVLSGIRGYHTHLPVVLATSDHGVGESLNRTLQIAAKFKNVKVLLRSPETLATPGKIWNALGKELTTPYALIARDLNHFNAFARLERQIRVIVSQPEVGVAGGAFRNATGHWKVGCYQTEIKNYFLRYFEGYKFSNQDCMLCDHLEGPFMVKSEVLIEFPFSESLSEDVVFEDWFLQIKNANVLVLNCPDVMYFTRGEGKSFGDRQQRRQDSWLAFAKQWEIHRVFLPPNILYLFSCKEVGLSCDPRKWAKAYLLPSCCLLQVARTLRTIDDFATEKGLRYELSAGSILGAVKLRSFLPWERDGDIIFESKDYVSYYKNQPKFRAKGMKLDSFDPPTETRPGFFKINTPEMYFEMFGSETLSSVFLPAEVREMPTRVNVLGVWVRAQASPGLYARNRYGPNYLKHAQLWEHLGENDGSGIYTVTGRWLPCPKKYHHACLDHYPNDGNVDFLQQLNH